MKKAFTFCILLFAFCIFLAACGNKCEHTYDNACDAACNECGEERTVTHNFSGDWAVDEAKHWHECQNDGCDGIDVKAEHSFDVEGKCECGAICEHNDVTLSFDGENHVYKGTCLVCGMNNCIEEAIEIIPFITSDGNPTGEDSAEQDSTKKNPMGYVKFKSKGGYTVEFILEYEMDDQNGHRLYTYRTGRLRLGSEKTLELPEGAYNYKVYCNVWNGSVWKEDYFEPWSSSLPFNCTFRTYGALPNPKMEKIVPFW